jgi:hypothetical protein
MDLAIPSLLVQPESDLELETEWNIWYHHLLDDWTINGYKKIYNISSVKDLWDFNNNISLLGGITEMHYFLMRKNIYPIWEHPDNKNGGSWSILIPIDEASELWDKLSAHIVSESFIENKPYLITGLSINQKNNIIIFKIWNNDKTIRDTNLLPNYLKKYTNIIYRPHKVNY